MAENSSEIRHKLAGFQPTKHYVCRHDELVTTSGSAHTQRGRFSPTRWLYLHACFAVTACMRERRVDENLPRQRSTRSTLLPLRAGPVRSRGACPPARSLQSKREHGSTASTRTTRAATKSRANDANRRINPRRLRLCVHSSRAEGKVRSAEGRVQATPKANRYATIADLPCAVTEARSRTEVSRRRAVRSDRRTRGRSSCPAARR